MMTERIREYIIGLGLEEEEAERLHQKYYKEYGLAIRGLVMHHKIDALDYDSKCDATLPLETVLRPDQNHKEMLRSLDRSKCRVWALTNAYKTVSVDSLFLLDLILAKTFVKILACCQSTQIVRAVRFNRRSHILRLCSREIRLQAGERILRRCSGSGRP